MNPVIGYIIINSWSFLLSCRKPDPLCVVRDDWLCLKIVNVLVNVNVFVHVKEFFCINLPHDKGQRRYFSCKKIVQNIVHEHEHEHGL